MQLFEAVVTKISRIFDTLSGIILAATALLIVANILGRALLQSSILGTYEMVGYLTAAVVGLALARCALENGHIAVGLVVERLPQRLQRYIESITGTAVFVFICFVSYNLFTYGRRIAISGEVSPTTQLIFYPIIYLVALGFFVLSLTVLLNMLQKLFGGEEQ